MTLASHVFKKSVGCNKNYSVPKMYFSRLDHSLSTLNASSSSDPALKKNNKICLLYTSWVLLVFSFHQTPMDSARRGDKDQSHSAVCPSRLRPSPVGSRNHSHCHHYLSFCPSVNSPPPDEPAEPYHYHKQKQCQFREH